MKNMKKLMITALLLVSLATITGCVKDSGPNGNANLQNYSYSIQPNQWYTSGIYGQAGWQYYHQFDVPEITRSVMEKGAVMVYAKQNDMFYPLPATTDNNGFVTTFQFNVYLGMVEIFVEDTDFQTVNPGAMSFKIVLFDQLKSLPKSLDIKDYKQVLAYVNE
jgi:hypothetical protein